MCDSGYRRDNHVGGRKQICPACCITKQQNCVFYNSDGSLKPYSFLCGYIEKRGSISLSKEHGTYHVKGFVESFEGATAGGGGFDQNEKHVHETFNHLHEARKFFRTFPKTPKVQEVTA